MGHRATGVADFIGVGLRGFRGMAGAVGGSLGALEELLVRRCDVLRHGWDLSEGVRRERLGGRSERQAASWKFGLTS